MQKIAILLLAVLAISVTAGFGFKPSQWFMCFVNNDPILTFCHK